MKIRALFKGVDKSKFPFKYKTGKKYTLDFNIDSDFTNGKCSSKIRISKYTDVFSDSDKFYSSLKAFLNDWDIL